MCIRDSIYCNEQHNRWAEYISFFEQAINATYSEATGYTPVELETNKKPNRFWSKNIDKPPNQNLQIPVSHKYDNAKKRMEKLGEKRIERFNRTHKLVTFHEGERVLLRSNPVGKRIDNTAKKLFRHCLLFTSERCKHLRPSFTEHELVLKLSYHFDRHNRLALSLIHIWIKRFNRTHKLITFHEGERVLLRSNPVGK